MKHTISFLAIFLPFLMLAQEGTVIFTEKIDIHRRMKGTDREAFIEMVPQYRSVDKLLFFSENASLYKTRPLTEQEEAELAADNSRGARWRMRMLRQDNVYYLDIAAENKVEKREFFGKKFLIEGDNKAFKWKLVPEQKEILGYACMKAVHSDSTATITVWFTSEITSATGPEGLNGLPGLILAVDFNDGERIIMAKEISTETLPEGTLIKPEDGKKVTQEEFRAIVEEKMKEMEAERGPGGAGRRFMVRP